MASRIESRKGVKKMTPLKSTKPHFRRTLPSLEKRRKKEIRKKRKGSKGEGTRADRNVFLWNVEVIPF